jgi:ADP-heptose:LPS heptosyltransferase/predicted SAM-dependent methyltransferase
MTWTLETSKGNESQKCRWEIVPYTRGKGLDIGCGPIKCFPHFIGVDNCHHEMFGQIIKPDIRIETCLDLGIFATASLDFVFSSHTLEHIEPENVAKCLEEWCRVLKIGGHLVLYLPDSKLYPHIGDDGCNPDHKWEPDYCTLLHYMDAVTCGWELVLYQLRDQDDEYSGLYVFKKTESGRVVSYRNPKPKKTAGVVRYGAFGDMLQASSVFAGLKKQGYHVTLYSSPPGVDAVRHDPNIDHLYLQDKDQVPNHCLGEFWDHERKKYNLFVNLSESVEGTFLAMPGHAQHEWPPDVRHKMMNRNYLEFQHELAGVPHRPQVRFYPTPAERKWALDQRAGLDYVLVWALAGSSVHKAYPYLDPIVARIMISYPDVHVFLVGGPEGKLLEAGWENETRVHRTCGVWNIRQSLAFTQAADIVVGGETGILNSVACEPMPKVVFLSHSSHENLTRDWVSTTPLWSRNTSCPGRGKNYAPACHQMHYGWKHCQKGAETKCAQCQEDLHPSITWDAIRAYIDKRQDKAA